MKKKKKGICHKKMSFMAIKRNIERTKLSIKLIIYLTKNTSHIFISRCNYSMIVGLNNIVIY